MSLNALRSLAVATALVVGMAVPANAVVVEIIPRNSAAVEIAPAGAFFGHTGVSGSFTDFFNFFLTGPAFFNASVSATNATNDISQFAFTVFNGSGPASLGGQLFSDNGPIVDNGSLHLAASGQLTAPGNYTIQVTGNALPSGTTFSGDIRLSQVPLPGALVLFGSGLVGLVALSRRRKQRAAQTFA